jgi:hypothetical protein
MSRLEWPIGNSHVTHVQKFFFSSQNFFFQSGIDIFLSENCSLFERFLTSFLKHFLLTLHNNNHL